MKENFTQKTTPEQISKYLEGRDPQKFITQIELDQTKNWEVDETNRVYLMIDDPIEGKSIKTQKFTPFCWTKSLKNSGFYKDDVQLMKTQAKKYGIYTEKLRTDGNERLEGGYKFIVKTTGTYRDLVNFFKNGGINPWEKENTKKKGLILILPPVEQFLIQTGKRLFKGFDEYTEVHRLIFDIETTSLFPKDGHIFLIGVKDNRGFKKIIDCYNENGEYTEEGERKMITEFFDIIQELEPSIITGYNSESFDWNYILHRMAILGLDFDTIKTRHPDVPLKRDKASLKLGAEIEEYEKTIMWGTCIMDTMHRVRQAMAINSDIREFGLKYISKESKVERPNRVYIDGQKLGTMWVENKDYYYNPTSGQWYELDGIKPDPKQVKNKTGEYSIMDGYIDDWKIVNGKFLITEYLLDDLLETELVDNKFSQASFLTAGLVPTNYLRSATMGTATLWKTLMLGWSYENNLAIPDILPKRDFVGGLSRLLKTGFGRNIVKFDYNSLYPSIQLTHDVFPDCDITHALEAMLTYLYETRFKYKTLKNESEINGDMKLADMYDKKQLPIKILNNSAFGSISAPYVFPWGDINVGETITCIGRQYLRLMVRFFMSKGYEPLVLDTDGCNFVSPSDVMDRTYIGTGSHKSVKKGKIYKGIEADVSEFNEKYMYGMMGLDIDYIVPATINLSRKNYAVLKDDGKIKLTGNTIKSKGLPTYIEKFLDKSIRILLTGDGKKFIDYYYEYQELIYNQQIPLSEIASKSRIKKTLKEYKNRGKNKNGKDLPRQAHMELVVRDNISVSMGDTIYYVNNGTKKTEGDIKLSKTKKDPPEGTLIFNCYMIPKEQLEKQPGLTGEYNVSKYLDAFNKRVEPLLVVFKKEVRDTLLITNPEDKQYFTSKELELISGLPMKEDQQDTLEELLTISEGEMLFWERNNKNPDFMIKERDLV